MALVLLPCQVVWFTMQWFLIESSYVHRWFDGVWRILGELCSQGTDGGMWNRRWEKYSLKIIDSFASLFSEKLVSNICVQFSVWERRETPRGDHHEGRCWRWRGCRKPRATQVRGLELVFYGRGVCNGKQVSHPWKTLWSLQRETMGFPNSAGFIQQLRRLQQSKYKSIIGFFLLNTFCSKKSSWSGIW